MSAKKYVAILRYRFVSPTPNNVLVPLLTGCVLSAWSWSTYIQWSTTVDTKECNNTCCRDQGSTLSAATLGLNLGSRRTKGDGWEKGSITFIISVGKILFSLHFFGPLYLQHFYFNTQTLVKSWRLWIMTKFLSSCKCDWRRSSSFIRQQQAQTLPCLHCHGLSVLYLWLQWRTLWRGRGGLLDICLCTHPDLEPVREKTLHTTKIALKSCSRAPYWCPFATKLSFFCTGWYQISCLFLFV